jgi:hypothetical protein
LLFSNSEDKRVLKKMEGEKGRKSVGTCKIKKKSGELDKNERRGDVPLDFGCSEERERRVGGRRSRRGKGQYMVRHWSLASFLFFLSYFLGQKRGGGGTRKEAMSMLMHISRPQAEGVGSQSQSQGKVKKKDLWMDRKHQAKEGRIMETPLQRPLAFY